MKTLLALVIALSACASAPVHVAAPAAPPNRALAAMHLNFPQADAIPVGDHTAFGRDGLRVILCIEVDAQHPPPCVAMADYTPKQEEPKTAPAPAPAPTDAPKLTLTPGHTEAPKKK